MRPNSTGERRYQDLWKAAQGLGGDGLPGPTDSWVTLGAIARETTRIRLGTVVTSATFRSPGHLAVVVAQVAERLREYADAGAQRSYVQVLDMRDLDHIALLGAELAPLVR